MMPGECCIRLHFPVKEKCFFLDLADIASSQLVVLYTKSSELDTILRLASKGGKAGIRAKGRDQSGKREIIAL